MPKDVISVKNLVKKYRRTTAVDGVSFSIKQGEIFAILGENGAGKTTTLEMIEGLRRPTDGTIEVLGHNVGTDQRKIKQKIGVQLQSSAYYEYLKLREILDLFGSYYAKSIPAEKLLAMVDLTEKADSLVGKMSGGQQQRFSIAAALVNDPEIVFLDEPTTGLDPLARRNLWQLITQIKESGKTIVLTTHYMEEAELLADRVAIMDDGRVVALDQTHKLIEQLENPYKIIFHAKLTATRKKQLEETGGLSSRGGKQDWYELQIKTQRANNRALKLIADLNLDSLTVSRATLEDVFISLTGKKLAE